MATIPEKYKYRPDDLPVIPGRKPKKTREEKMGNINCHNTKGNKTRRENGRATLGNNRFEERRQKYCVMIVRDVSRRVKAGFKAWCCKHGTNMTAALEDYMRRCANEIDGGDESTFIKREDTKRGRSMNGRGQYNRHYTPMTPTHLDKAKRPKDA